MAIMLNKGRPLKGVVKMNLPERVEKNLTDRAGDLVDRFLHSLDIKQNSRDTYRRGLKQFTGWIEERGITGPTREDLLEFKRALETKGLSSLTISGYLVAVRKFYEWAEGMKMSPNIAKGVKGAKRSKGFKKDPLTVDQVKELLSSIDRSTLQGLRDFALLNLLIRTGLRTIEVSRADIQDIRQSSGEALLWIQGKGRDDKDEFVLLTEETLRPLREYLGARGEVRAQDPLFASLSDRNNGGRLTTRSISRVAKDRLGEIGIRDGRLTAHSLRHTAITLTLLAGGNLQEAQALARHSDINTTLIYSHNINRIAHAPERRIDAILGN